MSNLSSASKLPVIDNCIQGRSDVFAFRVPIGWTLRRFGEIAQSTCLGTTIRGATTNQTAALVKMGDLKDGRISSVINERVDFSPDLETYLLRHGDFLFNTRNTPDLVGKVGVFLSSNFAVYDNNLLRIHFEDCVDSKFMGYLFNSDFFTPSLKRIVAGTTSVAAIYWKDLSKLALVIPPFSEQKKISTILTAVDEVIESTTAQINKLKDLKTGMMQELLTKGIGHTEFKDSPVGRIPKAWKSGILVDYLSFISYGFTNPMPESDRGPFMITAKDVNDSRIIYESARRTTQKAYDELLSKKSRPKLNDILVTKDGTLGRVAVVDRSGVCINQSVAVLRPNEKVLPWFLFYLLSSQKYQREMIDKAGGSTIKHIYITVLDKMEVALPSSIDEQMNIVTVLDSVQRKCELAENKLRKLIGHKKALMQDLLSGRVRVR